MRKKHFNYRLIHIFLAFSFIILFYRSISFAVTFKEQGYKSIAPTSIPQGADKVGMVQLDFRDQDGQGLAVSQIEITLNGTLNQSDISQVWVYFDNDGTYEGGNGEIDAILGGGPISYPGTGTINLDSGVVKWESGGPVHLYVAFDISPMADPTTTVGCEITSVTYGAKSGGTGNSYTPTPHNVAENIDDYEVTLIADGIALSTAEQGENDVQILKLTFTSQDADASTYIDSIRLHRVGTGSDSDIATGGVTLYDDSGSTPGQFDVSDQIIASGSILNGYVTLDPTNNLQITPSGNDIFFITLNISLTASVGKTVGLEVEKPISDIAFVDVISDSYTQKGYITSSSSTPTSGNVITITQATITDTTPPEIAYTNPSDGETDVSLTSPITVVFSEPIDTATATTSSFTLRDQKNNQIPGSVSASGSSATFTPDNRLSYETTYTATITTAFKDLAGNALAQDYSWSFTTIEYVPEPVAGNNMITPGSNEPVQIHIPEPPGGQNARVTVEVYTVTGERVAVLVSNRPYSEIISSLPILWYGKNQKQKNLGPGLYFIQIRSKNYKKVLKVLIVR